ncbi:MAG TPA: hypothetical protein VFF26_01600 [Gallionella sp.]|nr:hypothetical protein [Gallionella sp.]
MRSVHLIVPDLLPHEYLASGVAEGLALPALGQMLARGAREMREPESLEALLCSLFFESGYSGTPVAGVSAAFDGLGGGCWLRADPAHMQLSRNQLVLHPLADVPAEEAAQLCAALNGHFAGQGMEFFSPHPQRWYLRLDAQPDIRTVPMSQAAGSDVRGLLPEGTEGARWQPLFNEMQMLLFGHPLNAAREERGGLPVNCLWLWGNGAASIRTPCRYAGVSSNDELAEMFASAAGASFAAWAWQWRAEAGEGEQLLVWTGLRNALQRQDMDAWCAALQDFETGIAQPLLQALRRGEIAALQLDVPGAQGMRRIRLTRSDAWAFWRRPQRLAAYAVV